VSTPPTPMAGRRSPNVAWASTYNFSVAYRDTMSYLLEQKHPKSTWTLCTGAQGDLCIYPMPAMTQGPLFSLARAAGRENEGTVVRFNEIYLSFRVEVDEDAAQHHVTTATEFASVYAQLLDREDIRSSRVRVDNVEDMTTLRHGKRV
jgi:hypothetical protein